MRETPTVLRLRGPPRSSVTSLIPSRVPVYPTHRSPTPRANPLRQSRERVLVGSAPQTYGRGERTDTLSPTPRRGTKTFSKGDEGVTPFYIRLRGSGSGPWTSGRWGHGTPETVVESTSTVPTGRVHTSECRLGGGVSYYTDPSPTSPTEVTGKTCES